MLNMYVSPPPFYLTCGSGVKVQYEHTMNISWKGPNSSNRRESQKEKKGNQQKEVESL